MGVSYGAMVADNDMLGAILRANVPPEVTGQTLAHDIIADVVAGEGHFLGRPEPYARMRSDFLYPDLADRSGLELWATSDQQDMGSRATTLARRILETHLAPTMGETKGQRKREERSDRWRRQRSQRRQ